MGAARFVATQSLLVLGPPLLLTARSTYLDYARHGHDERPSNPFTSVQGDAGSIPTTNTHLASTSPVPTAAVHAATYALVHLDFKPSYWTLKLVLIGGVARQPCNLVCGARP